MHSLGTKETIADLKPEVNTKISIPIPIPKTIPKNTSFDFNLEEQYSLKSNFFDPSKMSPPNDWKCRLEERLKKHKLFQDA
jgi:hypothetical protein